jgi:parallel beta-helix repeat protein
MRKKNILLIVASSFLLLSITLHTPIGSQFHLQIIKSVKADPGTIIVPTNYTKIQEAINAAEFGDIIYVYNGTYYEHVVVNKTVALIGENKSTTIIDGGGTGIVVRSNVSDVEIRGFTIQNGGDFPDSGISIGSCINNTIHDNIIRDNPYGITLIGSNGCSVINNLIMNCSWAGIQIKDSSNNDIYENTMAYNSYGVWITSPTSLNSEFYHNNFIDNLNSPQSFGLNITWDNGTEGNYWDDYTGVDDDGDGIGNTQTPHLGLDNNPLIIPTRPFPVVVDSVIYLVAMLSNSTVSSFYFTQPPKEIGFYVNGPLNTTGFCGICVPTALMNNTYKVFVNGTEVPYTTLPSSNSTYSCLYFTYNHSAQEVLIIPEFSVGIFLLLFIILTLFAVNPSKRKKGTSQL